MIFKYLYYQRIFLLNIFKMWNRKEWIERIKFLSSIITHIYYCYMYNLGASIFNLMSLWNALAIGLLRTIAVTKVSQ